VGLGSTDGYYEEVREGQIMPEGSLSKPGVLKGVGPGLRVLRGIGLLGTSRIELSSPC
jgi:hypothetical protein